MQLTLIAAATFFAWLFIRAERLWGLWFALFLAAVITFLIVL